MIAIALGANIPSAAGSPAHSLAAALTMLPRYAITLSRCSSFYMTPAWPDPSDPPFINAVAAVQTALSPVSLLETLHAIEAAFGRIRGETNAPRPLDLDLIDYDGEIRDAHPVLPHPRMTSRPFVLVPLHEIAPDWRHPVTRRHIAALVDSLPAAERAAVVRVRVPPQG